MTKSPLSPLSSDSFVERGPLPRQHIPDSVSTDSKVGLSVDESALLWDTALKEMSDVQDCDTELDNHVILDSDPQCQSEYDNVDFFKKSSRIRRNLSTLCNGQLESSESRPSGIGPGTMSSRQEKYPDRCSGLTRNAGTARRPGLYDGWPVKSHRREGLYP